MFLSVGMEERSWGLDGRIPAVARGVHGLFEFGDEVSSTAVRAGEHLRKEESAHSTVD